MSGAILFPNVAGEEEAALRGPALAAAETVAHLWHLLFDASARRLGVSESGELRERDWPSGLGDPPEIGVLPEAPDGGTLVPWLATDAAAALAARRGETLAGAAPARVSRVHDKAFALEAAREHGLIPPSLRGLAAHFDPDAVADGEALLAAIESHTRTWPAWIGGRFTLKPRFGSSGRGRVAGSLPLGDADRDAVRGACARLAHHGGAVLEPWLAREEDLSAALWIQADGVIRLLGTARLDVDASGLYRGHAGTIDNRGRMTSASHHDEALREAAALVATSAAAQGYLGPCGVDAFSFRGEDGASVFRPVVEFNARFTLGGIVAGLLRRVLPRVKQSVRAGPEVQRAFRFVLDAGRPLGDATPDLLPLDLVAPGTSAAGAPSVCPALWIARTRDALPRAPARR